MHVIATDEAGYGPKLGPLVIAASTWTVETASASTQSCLQPDLEECFSALSIPVSLGSIQARVDDSKSVFKSGQGFGKLNAIVQTSTQWCGHGFQTLGDWIRLVAADDTSGIESADWYHDASDQAKLPTEDVQQAIESWSRDGVCLHDVQCRILTAKEFNATIDSGWNKADLLSQNTLQLVRRQIQQVDQHSEQRIEVFCDRHGGRRYYASVLQHVFSEGIVRPIQEGKDVSRYDIQWDNRSIGIAFTVKGDRFPPVALSSIHAKFTREWMMEAFNRYFETHFPDGPKLRPTAGYPVDADRFLQEIAGTIEQLRIDPDHLIRSR